MVKPVEALRVLRISHSGVVTAWRQRERELRLIGCDVVLVTAQRWEEGGATVSCEVGGDGFVVPVATLGRHPNGFVYDPRPLWRLLGSGHWDLIDLHEEPFGLAVAEVLAIRWLRAPRVPFVVASAQNIPKRYPPPFRWFERLALRRAAGAYTCNIEAGRILASKGLTGGWTLLPLGVDTGRFRCGQRDPPADRIKVGFVGRLIRHKGVDVLILAAALDERITVQIFGDGPELGALTALVAELGIGERVTFCGFVSEQRIPDVYRDLDVLAVPSVPQPGWIEQFGRVVVEAHASGVPVVASSSGALPEVVVPPSQLVRPGEPGDLADALTRYLDEPGLWERAREAGLAGAERYSWPRVASTQLALYRQSVARAAPVTPVGESSGRRRRHRCVRGRRGVPPE